MTRIQFVLVVLIVAPTAVPVCAQSSLPTWPDRLATARTHDQPATQPDRWNPHVTRSAAPNAGPQIGHRIGAENLHAPSNQHVQNAGLTFDQTARSRTPDSWLPVSGIDNRVPRAAYQPPRFNQTNPSAIDPQPARSASIFRDQPRSGFGWSSQQIWGTETNSRIQLAIQPEADSAIRQTGSAHWDDGPQNMSLDPDGFISKDLCNTGCDCLEDTDLCGDPMNVFRPTRAAVSWLYGDGDHLGITHWSLRRSLDIPEFNFLVTPGIDIQFLDGPRTPDLPSRIYTAFVDLNYEQEYDPNWTYQIGLRPMVATDADHADQSALRLGARFVLFRRLFERMEGVAGVYYYDREDVPLLPTLGLIYKPNENTRWHFVFPNPRISNRFMKTDNFDLWMYQAVEFGGGTWAIERANGFDDTFSYRDWRWLTGFELSAVNGRRYFLEVGLVFRRKVEYRSFGGDYKPANTGMVRAGMIW